MRRAIARVGARFNTDRMVAEYTDSYYVPASQPLR
jgi:hypothetical protein